MKLAYTQTDHSDKITNVAVDANTITFTSAGFDCTLDEQTLKSFLPLGEMSEINNLYIFAKDGRLTLRNKMMETYKSKRGGSDYLRHLDTDMANVGQIYLPFADATFEDAVIRLNVSSKIVSQLEALDAKEIENGHESFQAFAKDLFPALRVASVKQSEGVTEILVQVTHKGKALARADMQVYAKTDMGYLNRSRAVTDERGIARFLFKPLLLDEGEVVTIKFGYRYYSNIDSAKVTVTQ